MNIIHHNREYPQMLYFVYRLPKDRHVAYLKTLIAFVGASNKVSAKLAAGTLGGDDRWKMPQVILVELGTTTSI